MRKLFKNLISALLILSAFYGCSTETKEANTLDEQRAAFARDASERLSEETDGVAVNQIRELDGDVLIAVDYPSYAANEQISSQINEYINGVISEFKEEAASMGAPSEGSGLYTLSITYKPYQTDDNISFKFVENMFSGKTKRENHITALCFDKANGSIADISSFFNPQTSYLNALADTVRDYINRNYDFGQNKEEALFKEGTAPNLQNYSNFVVTPEHKFIFYFNAGQIADPQAGTAQAAIPMADLKNVLNARLRELYIPASLPPA